MKDKSAQIATPPTQGRKRASYLSPTEQARIIALRIAGHSLRQIARELGHSTGTVSRTLARPEIQAQIIADAKRTVEKYRKQLLESVPEALETLHQALMEGSLEAAKMVLTGTQVLQARTQLEVAQKNPFADLSDEDLKYISQHGHFPSDPCTCNADYQPVAPLELAAAPEPQTGGVP